MPGLENLYKEIIMDHYRSPRNTGELPPPACKAEGFNPSCGDELVLYVDIDDDGVITDVAFSGQGCSISQSSASMMTAAIKGTSVGDARELTKKFKAMMGIGDSVDIESAEDEAAIAEAKAAAGSDDLGAVAGAAEKPDLSMGDLSALRGVVKFPIRIKCAVLSWNTLLEALDQAS